MFEQIRMLSAQVRDAQVRALLFAFLDDGELVPVFLRAPAAKSIHHAYPGGLCEHTLSVMQLGWRACDQASRWRAASSRSPRGARDPGRR